MTTTTVTPDFAAIKLRQQAAWSAGDFAVIGTTLAITGERLVEAVDLQAGEAVLDVACGNGNASLAAARRWAEVTGIDYVPALIERARERAAAEQLPITLQVGDAEELPFPDASFDVVLSTYGVMFAPRQEQAAAELLRVCRPGGRIGLANWTPDGFVGQIFRVIGRYIPPPAGLASPMLWGDEQRLQELLGPGVSELHIRRRDFIFRYHSAEHWLHVFRTYYGPMERAFATLPADGQAALAADLIDLAQRFNRAGQAAFAAPGEYLEVVAHRA
jgi:SAM-dependent methyltransferase